MAYIYLSQIRSLWQDLIRFYFLFFTFIFLVNFIKAQEINNNKIESDTIKFLNSTTNLNIEPITRIDGILNTKNITDLNHKLQELKTETSTASKIINNLNPSLSFETIDADTKLIPEYTTEISNFETPLFATEISELLNLTDFESNSIIKNSTILFSTTKNNSFNESNLNNELALKNISDYYQTFSQKFIKYNQTKMPFIITETRALETLLPFFEDNEIFLEKNELYVETTTNVKNEFKEGNYYNIINSELTNIPTTMQTTTTKFSKLNLLFIIK